MQKIWKNVQHKNDPMRKKYLVNKSNIKHEY